LKIRRTKFTSETSNLLLLLNSDSPCHFYNNLPTKNAVVNLMSNSYFSERKLSGRAKADLEGMAEDTGQGSYTYKQAGPHCSRNSCNSHYGTAHNREGRQGGVGGGGSKNHSLKESY
jgi:hypothetical protein